ncbi:hypothetical protein LCGC14_1167460 [marine sediment metagenome]|uniref:Uncharacterized protein n=1 Tax=marine sediment metagenome TaxID=412755 RepID=A0A0F9P8X3_9ZZZZ
MIPFWMKDVYKLVLYGGCKPEKIYVCGWDDKNDEEDYWAAVMPNKFKLTGVKRIPLLDFLKGER